MMPKIISIVGRSYSGKTTLLEKIVRRLSKRNYRIGTIKHDVHGFEIDYPGKDSYRHFHSGSKMTMILGPDKMVVVKRLDKSLSLRQAIQMFFNNREHKLDLIITEGFKRENKPKIEIVRSKISSCPVRKNVHPVRSEDSEGNELRQRSISGTLNTSNGAGRDKDMSDELNHNGELSNGVKKLRKLATAEPICQVKEDNLVALISDIKITNYNIPQFGLNDISKITDFIEEKFICQKKIKK